MHLPLQRVTSRPALSGRRTHVVPHCASSFNGTGGFSQPINLPEQPGVQNLNCQFLQRCLVNIDYFTSGFILSLTDYKQFLTVVQVTNSKSGRRPPSMFWLLGHALVLVPSCHYRSVFKICACQEFLTNLTSHKQSSYITISVLFFISLPPLSF